MSSNITIERKCQYCEKIFLAKTVHTKYCSHLCNSRDYKRRKREAKVKVAEELLDDKNMDHEDGQFLVLYVPPNCLFTGEGDGFYDTHPRDLNDTRFLNPCFYHNENWDNAVGEVRRARQHGKFSLQTYQSSLYGIEEQEELVLTGTRISLKCVLKNISYQHGANLK